MAEDVQAADGRYFYAVRPVTELGETRPELPDGLRVSFGCYYTDPDTGAPFNVTRGPPAQRGEWVIVATDVPIAADLDAAGIEFYDVTRFATADVLAGKLPGRFRSRG